MTSDTRIERRVEERVGRPPRRFTGDTYKYRVGLLSHPSPPPLRILEHPNCSFSSVTRLIEIPWIDRPRPTPLCGCTVPKSTEWLLVFDDRDMASLPYTICVRSSKCIFPIELAKVDREITLFFSSSSYFNCLNCFYFERISRNRKSRSLINLLKFYRFLFRDFSDPEQFVEKFLQVSLPFFELLEFPYRIHVDRDSSRKYPTLLFSRSANSIQGLFIDQCVYLKFLYNSFTISFLLSLFSTK